jgi:hypothetical protein
MNELGMLEPHLNLLCDISEDFSFEVFGYLSLEDLASLARVCKKLSHMLKDGNVWRNLYMYHSRLLGSSFSSL